MTAIPNKVVRVIKDYKAPYLDPVKGKTGDDVLIDRDKTTDIPGWLWCIKGDKSGWIPQNYLELHDETGTLLCDYNAIELTVHDGETLTLHKEESGFIWATNAHNQTGWVPADHVETILSIDIHYEKD